MLQYNAFGCTVNDIVQAFNGATLSDFTTNGVSGSTIIANEMELAESIIVEKLSEKVLQVLSEMEIYKIPLNAISGSNKFTPDVPSISGYTQLYQLPKVGVAGNQLGLCAYDSSYSSPCGVNSECNTYIFPQNLVQFTDYTITNETITFNLSGTNFASYDYYIYYPVDASRLVSKDLKELVRNLVACKLGQQLFSSQDTIWTLVERYCLEATAKLALIDEYYIPAILKNKKYLNNWQKVRGGFSSIKIKRS